MRVAARGGAWRRVERVLVRQKLQAARGGMCEVFSGRSWLGFARDCLFCHSMPLLWQLDEQNNEIRELLDCGRDGGDSLLTVATG